MGLLTGLKEDYTLRYCELKSQQFDFFFAVVLQGVC